MNSAAADHVTRPGPTVRTGLIAYFAGNPVAANLLMLFLIVGGIVSGRQLAVQYLPELDLRTVVVTVSAPGASAREVEEDINRRVEESVTGLPGVGRVVGSAAEGVGKVTIEMATFADSGAVLDDVRNAVDAIENFPPRSAEQPEVELREASLEVMTLAVSSARVTENELRLAAEDVRNELVNLPSVSQVALRGSRDREISIELSEEELRRHDLSFAEIARIVKRASLNLTFGELRTNAGGMVLQTVAKREAGEEFETIPLITRLDGTIVTLGDVAEIRDGFVDEDIVATVNGEPAVFVRIDAAAQQSIVDMSDEIKAWLPTYAAPGDVTVSIWNDRAQPALDRISGILRRGIIGAMLVFICLVLVFDLRFATWISVGIPLSFIGSLLFFGPADMTLNLGTMFGFFLLVGIVVDDAVVVGESIVAERERGKAGVDAAISGARAMVGPITIGVCTTVLAFLPFLFVTAGAYQIVSVFPWVAVFVLLVSLVEAFFILPAHLSHESPWSAPPLSDLQRWMRGRVDALRDGVVGPTVSWSIRHVWSTLALGAFLVLASLALVRMEFVRLIVLDEDKSSATHVQADIRLPAGSPFEATASAAERFVDAARGMNEALGGTVVHSISVVVGGMTPSRLDDAGGSPNHSHLASVRIHLNEQPVRTATLGEIERMWRQGIGDTSFVEKLEIQTTRLYLRPDVAYALEHDDIDVLEAAAAELRDHLEAVPGLYEISDSLSLGKRHFEVHLTPAGVAAGLTLAGIGAQLRANYHGVEVQRIQRGHEEIKVMLKYPEERRRSLSELAMERIHRPGGGEVPLATVARLTEKRELAERMRIDGKQAALVSARADASRITPIQARRLVERDIIPGLIARYPDLAVERHGGARDERAMLETLGFLVPLVLIAMYALMAGLLRSYWKPLVAVAGIPIAMAGAIYSHWILGWDLTGMSIFGVIAVAGVVVNDTLVLLDRYNTLRRDDASLPAIAAVAAATRHRFRAVFLTSLTTVLGLSPLLYERSEELLLMVPFVVSMLGGLVFSSVFVLFFLPTLVMLVDGRRE